MYRNFTDNRRYPPSMNNSIIGRPYGDGYMVPGSCYCPSPFAGRQFSGNNQFPGNGGNGLTALSPLMQQRLMNFSSMMGPRSSGPQQYPVATSNPIPMPQNQAYHHSHGHEFEHQYANALAMGDNQLTNILHQQQHLAAESEQIILQTLDAIYNKLLDARSLVVGKVPQTHDFLEFLRALRQDVEALTRLVTLSSAEFCRLGNVQKEHEYQFVMQQQSDYYQQQQRQYQDMQYMPMFPPYDIQAQLANPMEQHGQAQPQPPRVPSSRDIEKAVRKSVAKELRSSNQSQKVAVPSASSSSLTSRSSTVPLKDSIEKRPPSKSERQSKEGKQSTAQKTEDRKLKSDTSKKSRSGKKSTSQDAKKRESGVRKKSASSAKKSMSGGVKKSKVGGKPKKSMPGGILKGDISSTTSGSTSSKKSIAAKQAGPPKKSMAGAGAGAGATGAISPAAAGTKKSMISPASKKSIASSEPKKIKKSMAGSKKSMASSKKTMDPKGGGTSSSSDTLPSKQHKGEWVLLARNRERAKKATQQEIYSTVNEMKRYIASMKKGKG